MILRPRTACCFLMAAALCGSAVAQQSLGSLKTEGAEIGGLVTVSNGRAVIGNNGAVAATGTQAADITLQRGGQVRVCGGSAVHVSQTTVNVSKPPLMLAVDRGAVEIRTRAQRTDAILTPDMRFELSGDAPLDLRIRVVPSGDTCVDNSGKDAPMLHVTETFGDGAYLVRPGQRVLFEHGSLREVVDHETSSCGCPKNGDALVYAGKGKKGDGKVPEVARTNPFPEAVSLGLEKPQVPQADPNQTHVQVATTLKYDGSTNSVSGPPGEVTTAASIAPPPATATPATPPPPASSSARKRSTKADTPTQGSVVESAPPPAGPNPFRAIGHFFRRLFGAS